MKLSSINLRRGLLVLGALVLILFPVIAPGAQYLQTVLILIFLFGTMALGWNVIAGFTGYVSLGQSAFLGIGAYTVGILSEQFHISPFIFAPLAGIVAALMAVILGATIMRAREHAYVIITIAFLFLMQALGLNLPKLTGGSGGITLPLPRWSSGVGNMPFYYAFFIVMAVSIVLSWWTRRTKFGMGLIAIREDEDKAAAIGVRTPTYKILATVASGALIGVAGGVYAYFLSFIDPLGMFNILVSVQIVLACLIGGRGTIWGPVLGAFIVVPMNEVTTGIASSQGVHLFIFGIVLAAVVIFLPRGILPTLRERWERRNAKTVAFERRSASGNHRAAVRVFSAEPTAASGPLLVVDGLVKRFGGLTAVDGCSFEVGEGTITGLIGPNGSGKTTVFNMITGMFRADSGAISLAGRRIERLQPWDRAYAGLGRTFQTTRLFPEMTVVENVVAPLRQFRWKNLAGDAVSGKEGKRAEELLDFVGMAHFAEQKAMRLSFGQQKLVELAQILMLEPRLILLDEPAGGINPGLIERITWLIHELNRQGLTFLIVEHNMPMVLQMCDPILVMARGRVIAHGHADMIQRDPVVLDAYLGEDWAKPVERKEA